MHTPRPTITLTLAILALSLATVRTATAQSNTAPEERLITAKAVDVLARAYVVRLRTIPNPSADDFRITALALRIIRRLAPDDTDLLRKEIEAWRSAGEEEQTLRATRELLKLDPNDEVAQLRITLAGIDRLQSVDARLRAYDRILGPRGSAVDPAVRSRVALDAALLARENGDQDAFIDYLTTATSLDPTNKEAAAVFGAFALERTDDPLQRIEILANIVLADPLDPNAHENLAFEALRHGAYAAALRCLNLATGIAMEFGWTLNADRIFDFALCEWNVYGHERAARRIQDVARDARILEQRRRDQILAEGLDPGPERELHLPAQLDILRLSVAVSARNKQRIAQILDGFLAGNSEQLDILDVDPDNAAPEEFEAAISDTRTLKLNRLWAILFSGQQVERARVLLDELVAQDAEAGDDPLANDLALQTETVQRFEGWINAVETLDLIDRLDARDAPPAQTPPTDDLAPDDTTTTHEPPADEPTLNEQIEERAANARRLLEPLTENDPSAQWALAELEESLARHGLGNERKAKLLYARLALENNRSALGTTAWFRLMALHDDSIQPPLVARQIDAYVSGIAPWLEPMVQDPSTFMAIRLEVDQTFVDVLGSIPVHVTVRNTSPWPLAVGRTIPKRILLSPMLRLQIQQASSVATPTVVLQSSRLRLEPTEEITVTVVPTREQLGYVLDFTCTATATVRWQALQNFTTEGSETGYTAGAITVSTLSDVVTRHGIRENVSADVLSTRIPDVSGPPLLRDILLARRMVVADRTPEAPGGGVASQTLVPAILDQFARMSDLERAIALTWFFEAGIGIDDDFTQPVAEAAAPAGTFASVALLAYAITDPADPRFTAMIASTDEDMSRLAFLTRERRLSLVEFEQAQEDAP